MSYVLAGKCEQQERKHPSKKITDTLSSLQTHLYRLKGRGFIGAYVLKTCMPVSID